MHNLLFDHGFALEHVVHHFNGMNSIHIRLHILRSDGDKDFKTEYDTEAKKFFIEKFKSMKNKKRKKKCSQQQLHIFVYVNGFII